MCPASRTIKAASAKEAKGQGLLRLKPSEAQGTGQPCGLTQWSQARCLLLMG